MSWTKVERAFYVEKNGKFQHIDIAVCTNCNGIHIPPEEANGCKDKGGVESYEHLTKRYKPTA